MDYSYIQILVEWIGQHPRWAGLFVFTVAFMESLALVGMVVPGALLLFATGAVVSTGAYPLWDALLYAILGAIAGDGLSFWLGWRYKEQLKGIWPLSRHPALFERGELFFNKHGGKSVALGRFVGPIRAIIPTVAGMMGMSPRRFVVINIFSAIAWAPSYILPGVVFGASLGMASQVASRLVILILALCALLFVGVWLVHRCYLFLAPRANHLLEKTLVWLQTHPLRGRFIEALIDPSVPEFRSLLIWAGLLVLTAATFAALLWRVPLALDHGLWQMLQQLRTPWADQVMILISQWGDGVVSLAIAAGVAVWLARRRNWLALGHLVAAIVFALVVPMVLKSVLQLPRPIPFGEGSSSWGFPSWHATMAVVLYGFIAVVVARELSARHRWLAYGLAVVPILLISFSRLYLGVHWLSDVLGGLALGLAWVALVGIGYRRHVVKPIAWRPMVLLALLAWGLAWPWHVAQSFTEDSQRYRLVSPELQWSEEYWWNEAWQWLPASRVETRGTVAQAFTLQWQGALPQIGQALDRQGWQSPQALTWAALLQWLQPDPQLDQLPLLPQVHDGLHESLVRIRREGEQVWVLRLWDSHVVIDGTDRVWLGYVAPLHWHSPLKLMWVPFTGPALLPQTDQLVQGLLGWRGELRDGRVWLIKPGGADEK